MTVSRIPFEITFHVHEIGEVKQDSTGGVEVLGHRSYGADSLAVWNKFSTEDDLQFKAAYWEAAQAVNVTYDIEWRARICCWAAKHALSLSGGDFVECGCWKGLLSATVCHYVDFNEIDKNFWLFDTFKGLPTERITAEEAAVQGISAEDLRKEHIDVGVTGDFYEQAKAVFQPWPRAVLVRGTVPESLYDTPIDKVCYLSIDMNLTNPELAALEFFWARLVPGAVVLLDDYGWDKHRQQKLALDQFARDKEVPICPLPTGQGMIIKM